MKGTIKKVMPDKKYGFIRTPEGLEYFFHKDDYKGGWNDLVLSYHQGEILVVEFEETESMKGLRAGKVALV